MRKKEAARPPCECLSPLSNFEKATNGFCRSEVASQEVLSSTPLASDPDAAHCKFDTQQGSGASAKLFDHLLIGPQLAGDMLDSLPFGDLAARSVQGDTARFVISLRKRLVDLSGTVILGLLTSPVLLGAGLAVRLSSTGPIFYRQTRIGRGNRAFTALKFRTMWMDAEERLSAYLAKDPVLRQEWESVNKLKNDPRVTPIGRVLRRFSVDELPQLWNVLVGDMSLIGPRPIVLAEVEKYGRQFGVDYVRVRPGMSGLWQVSGRNDTTYQQRVDYDSYYVRHCSLWLDVKILVRTFRAVISGSGAY